VSDAAVQELSFKRQDMDLYYLNAWESLFQFLFSIVLTPVMAFIPPSVPLNQIPSNIWYPTALPPQPSGG
jgi:hypothetical protein